MNLNSSPPEIISGGKIQVFFWQNLVINQGFGNKEFPIRTNRFVIQYTRVWVFETPFIFIEAGKCSVDEEFLRLLRNPKIQNRVHGSRPLEPIMSKINPVHAFCLKLLWFTLIVCEYLHLHLGFPSSPLLSRFSTKLLLLFMTAPNFFQCAIRPTFLYLFTLKALEECLKLWRCSLCRPPFSRTVSYLQPFWTLPAFSVS
jgi:hypothetical protein